MSVFVIFVDDLFCGDLFFFMFCDFDFFVGVSVICYVDDDGWFF